MNYDSHPSRASRTRPLPLDMVSVLHPVSRARAKRLFRRLRAVVSKCEVVA